MRDRSPSPQGKNTLSVVFDLDNCFFVLETTMALPTDQMLMQYFAVSYCFHDETGRVSFTCVDYMIDFLKQLKSS